MSGRHEREDGGDGDRGVRNSVTLRLKPKDTQGTTAETVEVDVFDFRLPCRYFRAKYKVAESGTFSLTTEFLLRFLHAAGSATVDEIGEFFGFDADEVTHAVQAAVSQGYVEHQPGGRLLLTGAGLGTFVNGSKRPHVYEVHERTDAFLLDLISFCPAEGGRPDDFTRNLPELGLAQADVIAVAAASAEARKAFQRHFDDLPVRQGRNSTDGARSLYSVDDMRSEKRAESVIPAALRLRLDGSGGPEPDLAAWHTGRDLDRRAKVLSSVAEHIDGFRVPHGWTSPASFEALATIAPEQVGRYVLRGQFNARAYIAAAARRVGELGSERSTVRVAGGLCTEANTRTLLAAAALLGKSGHGAGHEAIWLAPGLLHWGASRRFPALVPTIAQALMQAGDSQDQLAGGGFLAISPPVGREADRRLARVADAVLRMPSGSSPAGLEILLWPGRLAAILVHAVPDGGAGYPIPCGVISVDESLLRRVEAELTDMLGGARVIGAMDMDQLAVWDRLERVLNGS